MDGDRRGLHRSDSCLRESEQKVSTSGDNNVHIFRRQITYCSPQESKSRIPTIDTEGDTHIGFFREIIVDEYCKEFWPP